MISACAAVVAITLTAGVSCAEPENPSDTAGTGPEMSSYLVAFAYSPAHPDASPPFKFGRAEILDGGGVGAILPGVYGVGPIAQSATRLGEFVARVRTATRADKVDIVAHSQGAPVTDQYVKFDGGADKVGKVISFGGIYHGTSPLGMATLGRLMDRRPIIGPPRVLDPVDHPALVCTFNPWLVCGGGRL